MTRNSSHQHGDPLIPAAEAARAISGCRGDAVVVAGATPLRVWLPRSLRRELDVDLSDCTDKAASLALGIALAQPRRKVLVLDSEIGLRANLGSLISVGGALPRNLIHFLFEDIGHLATGGEPIVRLDRVNFLDLAQGCGYRRSCAFDNLEEFDLSIGEILQEPGPTFVALKVLYSPPLPSYPSRSMEESMSAVRQALSTPCP